MKYKKGSIRRFLYSLHTSLGVSLSLFLIILVVTGIILNHEEELQLSKKKLSWASSLYDIKAPEFIGSVQTEDFIISATSDSIFLISPDSEILKEFSFSEILDSQIKEIAVSKETNSVLFITRDGKFKCDRAIIDCKLTDEALIQSSDKSLLEFSKEAWLSEAVSFQKLVIDIHSGRILGSFGKLIVDLVALGLLFLTFSGIFLWLKKLKK